MHVMTHASEGNVATQIPSEIPYRVDLEISRALALFACISRKTVDVST